MANTMRLFTGTRLECAQCHNHPFDKWKQREFYQLVAFNGGMQAWLDPAFRYHQLATASSHGIGFRCALSL